MATRRARKIDRNIRKALTQSEHSADSEVLLTEILKAWGGPTRLAHDIKQTYDAAAEGSMIRQRLMEMIQRLIINNTKEDITNEIDPSEMSDEDLYEAANQLVGKMAVVGDGEDDEPARGKEEDARERPAVVGRDEEEVYF